MSIKHARRDARFVLWGGEVVRLREDHPHLNLKAGDQGYVWGVYDLEPPMYEADFYRQNGSGCAMMFAADEVERVDNPQEIRISNSVLESWERVSNSKAQRE